MNRYILLLSFCNIGYIKPIVQLSKVLPLESYIAPRKGTLERPDRVLELKQRCIDRRHRQSVDNGSSMILNGQENPTNNSLLFASNYQPAASAIGFIGKEDIPIPLGFLEL